LSEEEIIKKIKMNKNNFYEGLGWLARENKIYRQDFKYNLGETNLINDIGNNAGKIWKTLDETENIDIKTISEISKVDIKDAYTALGWLAREDKIQSSSGKETKYKLK
jgi:hypothetical protein